MKKIFEAFGKAVLAFLGVFEVGQDRLEKLAKGMETSPSVQDLVDLTEAMEQT